MAMLELKDITKVYRTGEMETPVLHGVTCSIEAGELVALVGASGSGKTTLMNILGCLDRPTSGSYRLDGIEASTLSSDGRAALRSRKIGFVFQSFNLLARTTALDNVMMPAAYSPDPQPDQAVRERATRLLERVGLAERMMHEPSRLSGGQQQRVAIARALINGPSLLLADEPTGNLDSRTSVEVLRMFEELNANDGLTVILVTHDASVTRHARRVIRMKDGLIQPDDTGTEAPAETGPGEAP